jgi:selenocysteine lyase/cysteine desulfurase
MPVSEAEFKRLGYRAVDAAAAYLAGLAEGPVFQRMSEDERGAILNLSLPAAPLSGEEILQFLTQEILAAPDGKRPSALLWLGEFASRLDGRDHGDSGSRDESQLRRRRPRGRFALRACILHYDTTEEDVDRMLETVRAIAIRVRDDRLTASPPA